MTNTTFSSPSNWINQFKLQTEMSFGLSLAIAIVAALILMAHAPAAEARPTDAGTFPNGLAAEVAPSGEQSGQQYRDVNNLTAGQLEQIQALVAQQVMNWSDTILGGDFQAAGDTHVDRVQAVYSGSTLLGYRVTYSETAWATDRCDFDPRDKMTLSSCERGKIVESMFVSPDFKDAQRDEQNFAHFLN